jgi:hypothetical protein
MTRSDIHSLSSLTGISRCSQREESAITNEAVAADMAATKTDWISEYARRNRRCGAHVQFAHRVIDAS